MQGHIKTTIVVCIVLTLLVALLATLSIRRHSWREPFVVSLTQSQIDAIRGHKSVAYNTAGIKYFYSDGSMTINGMFFEPSINDLVCALGNESVRTTCLGSSGSQIDKISIVDRGMQMYPFFDCTNAVEATAREPFDENNASLRILNGKYRLVKACVYLKVVVPSSTTSTSTSTSTSTTPAMGTIQLSFDKVSTTSDVDSNVNKSNDYNNMLQKYPIGSDFYVKYQSNYFRIRFNSTETSQVRNATIRKLSPIDNASWVSPSPGDLPIGSPTTLTEVQNPVGRPRRAPQFTTSNTVAVEYSCYGLKLLMLARPAFVRIHGGQLVRPVPVSNYNSTTSGSFQFDFSNQITETAIVDNKDVVSGASAGAIVQAIAQASSYGGSQQRKNVYLPVTMYYLKYESPISHSLLDSADDVYRSLTLYITIGADGMPTTAPAFSMTSPQFSVSWNQSNSQLTISANNNATNVVISGQANALIVVTYTTNLLQTTSMWNNTVTMNRYGNMPMMAASQNDLGRAATACPPPSGIAPYDNRCVPNLADIGTALGYLTGRQSTATTSTTAPVALYQGMSVSCTGGSAGTGGDYYGVDNGTLRSCGSDTSCVKRWNPSFVETATTHNVATERHATISCYDSLGNFLYPTGPSLTA